MNSLPWEGGQCCQRKVVSSRGDGGCRVGRVQPYSVSFGSFEGKVGEKKGL